MSASISCLSISTFSRRAASRRRNALPSWFSAPIIASVSSVERMGLVIKRIFPPREAKSDNPATLYVSHPVVK